MSGMPYSTEADTRAFIAAIVPPVILIAACLVALGYFWGHGL